MSTSTQNASHGNPSASSNDNQATTTTSISDVHQYYQILQERRANVFVIAFLTACTAGTMYGTAVYSKLIMQHFDYTHSQWVCTCFLVVRRFSFSLSFFKPYICCMYMYM